MLDQIWARPKEAKEILAKYAEQNKSILEQERMMEARMKKSRLRWTYSTSTTAEMKKQSGEIQQQQGSVSILLFVCF